MMNGGSMPDLLSAPGREMTSFGLLVRRWDLRSNLAMGVPRSSSLGYTSTVVAPRTSGRVTRRVLGLAVLTSMIAVSRVTLAAPFDPGNTDWEGCARLVEI